MAGQYRFKDSNGNIVAQISASVGGAIAFSGSVIDFTQANNVILGNVQLAGTASNALLLDGFDSQAFAFTSSIHPFTASIAGTNTFTSSATARLNSIETISASNISRINSLETTSASVDTLNTTQNSRLDSLAAKTGSLASTGSNTFIGTQTITGSLYISSDLIVQGSSSLQNITASAVSIGTNIINLNTANPAIRYAGLVIGDSGSIGSSGSFFYDSVQDEMIFVHRGANSTVTSSVVLMGPQTYDSVGSETYPTLNRIQKGTGNEHLSDSNIFDNGTNIRLLSSTEITGSLNIGATSYPSVNLYTTSGTNFAITNRFTDNRLSIDRIGTGELVNILSNGNVGIGITNPANLLHLTGASSTPSLRLGSISIGFHWDIGRENQTTGDFIFNNANGGATSEKLRITAADGNILVSSGATIYNSSGALYMRAGTSGDLILGAGGTNGYMRIGSTGNVGIGTTNAQFKYHQYGGKFILNSSEGSYGQMQIGNTATGQEATIIFAGGAASFGNVVTSGDGSGAVWAIGSSTYGHGVTKFGIANVGFGNNVITLTSAGRVGIGFTSPNEKLSVAGEIASYAGTNTAFYSYMNYLGTTYNFGPGETTDNVDFKIAGGATWGTGGNFRWSTHPSGGTPIERLRIRPDGRVYVGGSSISNSPLFGVIGGGVWDGACIGLNNTGTGGQIYTIFSTNNQFGQGGNALLFYNTTNATNNLILYSNGNYDFLGSDVSDIRLKQDIENINFGLTEIMQLSPKSYHLKSKNNLNGENELSLRKRYGFIAQEVQPILPDTITGGATADEYLGLDYNGVLAVAVKAIQELKIENNALKERIEVLENK